MVESSGQYQKMRKELGVGYLCNDGKIDKRLDKDVRDALQSGKTEIVKLLMDAEADVNIHDKDAFSIIA